MKGPCPMLCIITAISDVAEGGGGSGAAACKGWKNEEFKQKNLIFWPQQILNYRAK